MARPLGCCGVLCDTSSRLPVPSAGLSSVGFSVCLTFHAVLGRFSRQGTWLAWGGSPLCFHGTVGRPCHPRAWSLRVTLPSSSPSPANLSHTALKATQRRSAPETDLRPGHARYTCDYDCAT